jgi:hypothetical protein
MNTKLLPHIAALAVMVLAGCAVIQPGHDPLVVNAERTTQVALDAFDAYLLWEYENRVTLSVVPEIRQSADRIRAGGQQWLQTAREMTKAYKHNRSDDNKLNLQTSIAVLRTAIKEVERYIGMEVPPDPRGN